MIDTGIEMALGQYLCIDNGSLIIKQLIRLIKDVLDVES